MSFGIGDFLSRLLKDCELFEQRTALGNLLQNAGAAAVKLRSPSVRRVFVLGARGCNKNSLDDLRLYLDTVLWVIRSLRYAGASPWIAL